jgi:hypothetical protein
LNSGTEVDGEGSQRVQKSLAAGEIDRDASSLLLQQGVGDEGTKSDSKKRKYQRFDKMSHHELLVCAWGLSYRVKVADQRTLKAKRTIAKAETG